MKESREQRELGQECAVLHNAAVVPSSNFLCHRRLSVQVLLHHIAGFLPENSLQSSTVWPRRKNRCVQLPMRMACLTKRSGVQSVLFIRSRKQSKQALLWVRSYASPPGFNLCKDFEKFIDFG